MEPVELAKKAIDKVLLDTRVPIETTIEQLEEIRVHLVDTIQILSEEKDGE